jgi:hypothetical protein
VPADRFPGVIAEVREAAGMSGADPEAEPEPP